MSGPPDSGADHEPAQSVDGLRGRGGARYNGRADCENIIKNWPTPMRCPSSALKRFYARQL